MVPLTFMNKDFFKKNSPLIFISFGLLIFPYLFWHDYGYRIGGDDSLLYYLYPEEMIKHYILNIPSDNWLGGPGFYYPQWQQLPFFFIIAALKSILPSGINMQLICYGLNLSLGFLFFYLFLGLWIKGDGWNHFWARALSSLIYIFSAFTFYTLWRNQLQVLYLISIFPLALYLFFKALFLKNIFYLVGASIVSSILGVLVIIPWLAAVVLSVSPLLAWVFIQNKKIFILYFLCFIGLFGLLNFYWLFHVIYGLLGDSYSPIQSAIEIDFVKSNERLIREVSYGNVLANPLLNLFHGQYFQQDPMYNPYYKNLLPLELLITGIAVSPFFFLTKVSNNTKQVFLAAVGSWLLALYFFNVKIGPFGVDLFIWLTNNIPGFTMFRNMYDKFAFGMAFTQALLFGISLNILFNVLKSDRIKKGILLFSIIYLTLKIVPYGIGDHFKMPYFQNKSIFMNMKSFNSDFLELTEYLDTITDDESMAWLPLNPFDWTVIQDNQNFDNFYIGVSPLLFLSKKNDYMGKLSFSGNLELMEKLAKKQDYRGVGEIFRKHGIGYVILNHDINRYFLNSGLCTIWIRGDICKTQQAKAFLKEVLGEKLKQFGKRYELYRINPKYRSGKFLLRPINEGYLKAGNKSGQLQLELPNQYHEQGIKETILEFNKVEHHLYEIHIKRILKDSILVFNEPFHNGWELRVGSKTLEPVRHYLTNDFANGWMLNSEFLKANLPKDSYQTNKDGSLDIHLRLYFKPYDYYKTGWTVSGLTLFVCLITLMKRFFAQLEAHRIVKKLFKKGR